MVDGCVTRVRDIYCRILRVLSVWVVHEGSVAVRPGVITAWIVLVLRVLTIGIVDK